MVKDHTVNKVRGIIDFAYIPFEKAYRLVEPLTKVDGSADVKKFYELINREKTGWLGLEIKSARVWGLIESKKMILTKKFYKLSSSNDPNEKLEIKRKSFLNVPLFKKVFEKYSKFGLPRKNELIIFLESEDNINPTYSPSVAKTIIDSINKYFKEYGINPTKVGQGLFTATMKKEDESLPFDRREGIMNIKVTSSKGTFNINVINKDGIEIAQKLIKDLWEGESDTDEKQVEGAHET